MSGDDDPFRDFNHNLAGQSSPSEEEQIDPALESIEDNEYAQAYSHLHGMIPDGLPLYTAPPPGPEGILVAPDMDPVLNNINRIKLHVDQSPSVGEVNLTRGGRAKNLKAIDPPCVARVTIERDPSGSMSDRVNGFPLLDNPKLFCSVQLELAPGEQPYEAKTCIQPVVDRLKGNRTSSVQCVEAPNGYTKCFFIFRDLTVLECGIYRLKLTLHCNLDGLGAFDHYLLAEAYTNSFEIFPKKTFPGYGASTELTDWLAGKGTKLTRRSDSKKVALTKKNAETAKQFAASRRQQGIFDEDTPGLSNGSAASKTDTIPFVGLSPQQFTPPVPGQVVAKKRRGRPKKQKVTHEENQYPDSSAGDIQTAPQQPGVAISHSSANANMPMHVDATVGADFSNVATIDFADGFDFTNTTNFMTGASQALMPTMNTDYTNLIGDITGRFMDENPYANHQMEYHHSTAQNFIQQNIMQHDFSQLAQPSEMMSLSAEPTAVERLTQRFTWTEDHVNKNPDLDHDSEEWHQDEQPWSFGETYVYDQQ